MTNTIEYLLQSGLSVSLLYLFYRLVLANRKNLQLNRFFLLFGLLFSLIIPLVQVKMPAGAALPAALPANLLPELVLRKVQAEAQEFSVFKVLFWAYGTGVLVLLLRFLGQLFSLFRLQKNSVSTEKYQGITVVKVNKPVQPFSFGSRVFLYSKANLAEDSQKIILEHELVHVRQWHTLDVVVAELVAVLHWYNPVVWLYKNSLRDVHEFLADQSAVRSAKSISDYSRHILSQAMFTDTYALTHTLFNSQLKKRVMMMNQKTSTRHAFARAGMALSFVFVLFYCIACNTADEELVPVQAEAANKTNSEAGKEAVVDQADVMPVPEGGMEAFYKHIMDNLKTEKPGKNGKVFVEFVVNKAGQVQDAKVLKGMGEPFDSKALSAVSSYPKWEPGIKDGKPVAVKLVVPIAFQE
ncbi:MAG: M56 family metallopeptidase [Hymenobacteraceae bacterium]|mgnify:CR=1 FL=1|nr:M56 family metallopeptidase [Hymenobacteraceae bacterium]MDX5395189.1 M56 family metallopeptidase [Hymenobacteraceae bacterium]MDX5442488.1 M56 family metallopeptidase [Hymenobacteraceae bacterium]MDX5511227.1 M56 family metallopeptidase [Hymenobacteraceae bacterium]